MNHNRITNPPEVRAANTKPEMIHARPLKGQVGTKTPITVFSRIWGGGDRRA